MQSEYLGIQKILHWLLAVLLIFWLFVSGELVEGAEGADKGFILMIHSGGAIVIFALMMWRFWLRLNHPVPPLPSLSVKEINWSRWVHVSFYLLVALMVFSGLLQGMFFEQDVIVFGLVNITFGHKEALMSLFHSLHGLTGTLLKLLLFLHVAAVIKHQFFDKQPILKRMG